MTRLLAIVFFLIGMSASAPAQTTPSKIDPARMATMPLPPQTAYFEEVPLWRTRGGQLWTTLGAAVMVVSLSLWLRRRSKRQGS